MPRKKSSQAQDYLERDFYLQVLDLAESGKTFKAIAAKLQRPISTVRLAYLTAKRNIALANLAKKDVPLFTIL